MSNFGTPYRGRTHEQSNLSECVVCFVVVCAKHISRSDKIFLGRDDGNQPMNGT